LEAKVNKKNEEMNMHFLEEISILKKLEVDHLKLKEEMIEKNANLEESVVVVCKLDLT